MFGWCHPLANQIDPLDCDADGSPSPSIFNLPRIGLFVWLQAVALTRHTLLHRSKLHHFHSSRFSAGGITVASVARRRSLFSLCARRALTWWGTARPAGTTTRCRSGRFLFSENCLLGSETCIHLESGLSCVFFFFFKWKSFLGIEAFFRSLFNLTFSHLIKRNLLSAMCYLQWPHWVFSLHLGDVLSFEDPLSDQSPESFWLSQSSHYPTYPTFNPSLCVTFLSFFSQHPFLLSLLIFYTWPLGGVTFPIIKQEANVEHFRVFLQMEW